MINPAISKRVTAIVSADGLTAIYQGVTMNIHYRGDTKHRKPGRRHLWLRYSITLDCFYLKAEDR